MAEQKAEPKAAATKEKNVNRVSITLDDETYAIVVREAANDERTESAWLSRFIRRKLGDRPVATSA